MEIVCGRSEVRVEIAREDGGAEMLEAGDDEVVCWKAVITSTGNSDELFMANIIELGSISRVDIGRIVEVLTAGICEDVEDPLAEVDLSNTDKVRAGGTNEVEEFRSAC